MSALLLIVIILIVVGLVIGFGYIFFSGTNFIVQSFLPGFPLDKAMLAVFAVVVLILVAEKLYYCLKNSL